MPQPNVTVSKVRIDNCPRCGGIHESLTIKPLHDLSGNSEPDDHWLTCPAQLEPILIRLAPRRARQSSSERRGAPTPGILETLHELKDPLAPLSMPSAATPPLLDEEPTEEAT